MVLGGKIFQSPEKGEIYFTITDRGEGRDSMGPLCCQPGRIRVMTIIHFSLLEGAC